MVSITTKLDKMTAFRAHTIIYIYLSTFAVKGERVSLRLLNPDKGELNRQGAE